MRKSLFILSALLLTGMGAWAVSERTAPDGEEVTVEWTADGSSDFNYGLKTLADDDEADYVYRTLALRWGDAIPDGFTAYTCESITDEGALELTKVEKDSIEAGVPYIMYGPSKRIFWTGKWEYNDSTCTQGVLTGTFFDMADDDFSHDGTQYLLQDQETYGQAFYAINEDSNVSLGANHCYLTYTGNGDNKVKAAISFPSMGEATGIKAVVKTTTDSEAIYDLSGRRVAKTQKGVYIKGGKKVLVK